MKTRVPGRPEHECERQNWKDDKCLPDTARILLLYSLLSS
jgi:hypothetical protein